MPRALRNQRQPTAPLRAAVPASGIQQLTRWYLMGLGLMALALLVGQGTVQYALDKQVFDTPKIRTIRAETGHRSLQLLAAETTAGPLLGLLIGGALIFLPGGVRRALEAQRDMEAEMADQESALAEADRQVAHMQQVLANLSTMDTLTGLKNQRVFQEHLDHELRRALRHGHPLSLMMVDVDRFQSYNDAYGRSQGDQALKRVAGLLAKNARTSDIPARIGGAGFAVILTETDMMGSVVLGERLRQSIAGDNGLDQPLTASIGIATLTPGMGGVSELIAQADRALYAAKGEGRNRVSHAHRLPAMMDDERPQYAQAA